MERIDELDVRSTRAVRHGIRRATDRLASFADRLESLSPLGVLARGYSVTTRLNDGSAVRNASEFSVGDRIRTRLSRGSVTSRIELIDGSADDTREVDCLEKGVDGGNEA